MPSLNLDNGLIWFAHCPKAGGTSVETLMVETWGDQVGHLHWGWDLWWRRGGWRVADPPNSPQHLIWDDACASLDDKPDTVFALVRDPVTRMVSEYRYQRRHRRGTLAGRALTFLPFAFWLRLMMAAARCNPYAYDNHLRPQSDFVPDGAEVFRLEDGLEPVVEWLSAQTKVPGLSVPVHLLSTGPGRQPDQQSLARISQAFVRDYSRFGYSRPSVAPYRRDIPDRVADLCGPLIAFLDRRGCL